MLGVLSVITALAAPFGEPAFQIPGGVTGCLAATGAPGELIATTGSGAVALQAGPAGVTARTPLPYDEEGSGCPAVAAQSNGAGVAAVTSADVSSVRAFLR